MRTRNLPFVTIAGLAVALVAVVAFFVLIYLGSDRTIFGIAGAAAWLGFLLAMRPFVERESISAFGFAFLLLGFFIFFVDQTYEYEGRVRLFPLLIGYMGIILSILDILSLTASEAGAMVTRTFGKAFDPSKLDGRNPLREILVLGSICLIVVAIYLFGFLIATPLSVALWMMIGGRKHLGVSLATAAGALAFVWLLFELALQYELYRGVIWEMMRSR
ncbi:MAG: tripartite tricarboxylate transporter TctB family protein [Beijerinckiaceae bacterium]